MILGPDHYHAAQRDIGQYCLVSSSESGHSMIIRCQTMFATSDNRHVREQTVISTSTPLGRKGNRVIARARVLMAKAPLGATQWPARDPACSNVRKHDRLRKAGDRRYSALRDFTPATKWVG